MRCASIRSSLPACVLRPRHGRVLPALPVRLRVRVHGVHAREPTPSPPLEADDEMEEAYMKTLEDTRLEEVKDWDGFDV